ncbi:MAG TPA: acyltransferase family protein [Pirellulales bacterium]|jgi:peptidoglycan/LPS O-acetylase OafA/YrhL
MGASLPLSIASGSLSASSAPIPIIHLLRAIGSHLIVWHHLAFYGPVSDIAYTTSPVVFDWLVDYGRMAVQVFFVMGGFVTARKLSRPQQWTPRILGREIVARYRRIGIPYLTALLLAVAANEVARRSMEHESISATPSMTQLVAHAFFLQDVLDYEPVSAGIWYLAIDFQLGLLTLVILAASQWMRGAQGRDAEAGFRTAQYVFWPLAAASLLWLNRFEQFDHYALYFFGSYFGGMVVAWTLAGRLPRTALLAYVGLMAAALAVDWRPRLVVSVATGLTIFFAEATRERRNAWTSWASGLARFWGDRSYSLFLIHFPVCLVITAWIAEYVVDRPHAALGVMILEYAVSLIAAVAFYRFVEGRTLRTGSKREAPSLRTAAQAS